MIYVVKSAPEHPDRQTAARLARALQSRKNEYIKHPDSWAPVTFSPRRTGEMLGDAPVPFVRDMIETAMMASRNQWSFIGVVNADIGFFPGTTKAINMALKKSSCAWAHRRDVSPGRAPVPGDDVAFHPGSDFFVFSVNWWLEEGVHIFPDMLLGREAWDAVMRNIMRRSGGVELPGIIWHERHASFWERNRQAPGSRHNARLAGEWFAKYGGGFYDWRDKPVYK